MNLILITIDCLRADHLSCLGYRKKTTPNLDYLASKGLLFSQAISVSSWTLPSFLSMFTSTYPLMYKNELRITNSRTTVAQVLKEHGYTTAGFHSNTWLSAYFGYHKGFDIFHDSNEKNLYTSPLNRLKQLVIRTVGTNGRLYKLLSGLREVYHTSHKPYCAGEDLNKKVTAWLPDNPNNLFLWLHYMDVHEPYSPPSPTNIPSFNKLHIWKLNQKAALLRKRRCPEPEEAVGNEPSSLSSEEVNELIDLYDANVRYVDGVIGSLLRILNRSNILDDTFIVITADHGQEFMEHRHYGHVLSLYDELIHVPLIIMGPGLQSQVISQQVSLLDLAPTILDILGVAKPEAFLGNSLLPLVNGNRLNERDLGAISESYRPSRAETYHHTNLKMFSVRTGKWKYIYNEVKQDELYSLEDDPKETQNIISAHPEIATELRAKIMAHIEFEDRSTPSERELIKAKIRKLKGSGKI